MSDSLGVLLSDTSRFIRRRFDQRARSLGVSRAQWQVLFALSRNEGVNQAGLADLLEVETITVGRMVDRLEEAGLVERRADPADRRAWRLHLTDKARPLIERLRAVAESITAEALAGIDSQEQALLTGILTRLRANVCGRGDATTAIKIASNA